MGRRALMYVPILAIFVRAELQDNKNQSGMTLTPSLRKLSGYRFVNTAGGLPPSPSSIGEPERSGSFSTALLMMCGVRANVFQFGGKFTLVARGLLWRRILKRETTQSREFHRRRARRLGDTRFKRVGIAVLDEPPHPVHVEQSPRTKCSEGHAVEAARLSVLGNYDVWQPIVVG